MPLRKVFECFEYFSTSHVMFLNPCHAFLSVKTIQSVIDDFISNEAVSATSVLKTNDWIFSENGSLIYPLDIAGGNTKDTTDSFRVAHAFHVFDRVRFLEKDDMLWAYKNRDPQLCEISKIESIDIDDNEDFFISESLYNSLISGAK